LLPAADQMRPWAENSRTTCFGRL